MPHQSHCVLLIACQLKEDSALDPGKQKKLGVLTKAVMTRTSESDIHKFGVEAFMRVALLVRSHMVTSLALISVNFSIVLA